ncbi:MAG TPA: flavin reductase family protein [Phycisphaerae bacterium]|nr:flavin reductase family protein [Phycisphaerae bacterium]HRY67952.1 flavin reductase family protein [Phycisphaerae bacterium]HSA26689.1 flavin reductase family protein [Phycisphaerae bacterium]
MDDAFKTQVAQPLGLIASGSFVLTAREGGHSTGILVTWVQQAGFDPPTITVAVKHGRPIEAMIKRSGHFVLNIIGEDSAKMYKHFGKGAGASEPAFEGLAVRNETTGVIVQDCIAHLGCKVTGKIETGDHTVFVGQVVGGAIHNNSKPHLHTRLNGFNY